MNSKEFFALVKNPQSQWNEIEVALDLLGKWAPHFFEGGNAHALVMRGLREGRQDWLLASGWDPLKPFRSDRKQLSGREDWLSPALAGKASLTENILDNLPSYNLDLSWMFACGRDKNLQGMKWMVERFTFTQTKEAWWGAFRSEWHEGLDFLLTNGFPVDARAAASNKTTLQLAVEANKIETALFLLERGANPSAHDGRHAWAAASAVKNADPTVLLALIAAGLDLNPSLARGETWISLADMANRPHSAEILINAGAPVKKQDKSLISRWKHRNGWQGVAAALDSRILGETVQQSISLRPSRRL